MIAAEIVDGVVLLRMDDGKANAIQGRFLGALDAALDEAGDAAPLVLTGARRIFSAGLDLPALAGLSRPAMDELMREFHRVMLRLFLRPAPVVCAVNGHAIAGGCILAMQGDRRVMADGEGKIGVNEVRLGLSLPAIAVETFRAQLAPPALAAAALEGHLFSPAEAAAAGLVDEVAPAGDLVARAVLAARALAPDGPAFAEMKRLLRRPAAEALSRSRDEDSCAWLDGWFSEPAQRRIGETVAKLKGRSA
ncbi:MAG TPA: enoyl-CoA hydratase/isomerase family protein [Thermoanaerobaculia bacterium]|nr:enoyl-CoA hydratase/isomerase family protein [Thermoanaerobaculia bacterium]